MDEPAGEDRDREPTPAERAEREGPGSGRKYLVGAGVTVICFVGITGFVLGTNSPAETARLFGVIELPVTPLSLGMAGVVLASLVVLALFGLVTVATRRET